MKRRILFVATAVCMVAILAMGSLAYFSAQDTVVNQFCTESDDPNEVFSLDLYETDPADPTKKVDGLTFPNFEPGDVLHKDPTVQNTGKNTAYVRVLVTVTDYADWAKVLQKHAITDLTEIFKGYDEDAWSRFDEPAIDAAANTITYTFYLDDVLEYNETAVLFNQVAIPGAFDQYDLAALNSFNITVVAQSIQAENTGDSAVEAFALWNEDMPA